MRTRRLASSMSLRARRRAAARDRQRLAGELLETRLCLAQTTGLFLNNPGTAEGYVLFAPNTSTVTYLMDKDANIINQWTSLYTPGLLGYLQPDGSLLRDAAPHGQGGNGSIVAAGAGGLLERFDWNGTKNWEFAYDDATHLAHHDFEVLPNGNILLIAWGYKTEAEATLAGRDPNLPGPGFLYPDHIVEVDPDYTNGGGTIVWEWHVWDHLVQEFDATKANYYGPTGVDDHPELVDLNYVSDPANGGGAPEDWTHANGIDYNAELDQIVLSVREFSEFWIIDHSTTTAEAAGHTGGNSGQGGDLLYRWGNPEAYDRGTAGDRKLFFQHDPRWIEDGTPGAGHITVFNNGYGRPGTDYSSVEEIATPVDGNGDYPALAPGQPHAPATATWTYNGAVADHAQIISGTVRLPNGNTLVDYGSKGIFSEVNAAGQEVWRYVNPYTGFGQLGPEQAIPSFGFADLLVNFTFQVQHYPVAYVSQVTSTVAGRQLFYNQSAFDGNDAAINAADDGAIAPDKTAYLPGDGLATFANVSSYSKGINGIAIDLAGGGAHTLLDANDFVFKVGNNNAPGSWGNAPAPTAISVRTGAGVSGADRVEITWANGAIKNTWLEVQVLATTHTGLATPDVFFFGNRIGDTGSPTATSFTTTTGDASTITAGGLGPAGGITNVRDIDRSNTITVDADRAAALANTGAIVRLNWGTVVATVATANGRDARIATALAAKPSSWVTTSATVSKHHGPVASVIRPIDARAASQFYSKLAPADSGYSSTTKAKPATRVSAQLDDGLLTTLAVGVAGAKPRRR
ncbi:MAG: aryl-sulfate sulfotransferase [Pirellulales bacterium]